MKFYHCPIHPLNTIHPTTEPYSISIGDYLIINCLLTYEVKYILYSKQNYMSVLIIEEI